MNPATSGWRNRLRMVWILTSKDILEAVRSKNTLPVIISVLFLIVFYRYLPAITDTVELPQVRVFDAGNSTLPAYLDNSRALEARTGYESVDQLLRRVGTASGPELGLVVPDDFDRRVASGEELVLEGYLAYWVGDRKAEELTGAVEAELTRLLGRPARLVLSDQRAYPTADDGGAGTQTSLAMLIVVIMVGVSMVPHLMLEEKQSRTLDVLLVSPATEAEVVVSKALTGLFYCGVGLAVALGLNREMIVHWAVALPVLASLALLTVAIGLWLGTKIESRPQLMLWAWVFLVPLFLPIFIILLRDLFPDIVGQVVQIVPSAAASVALNQAYVEKVSWAVPLLASVWILICAAGVIGATVWLMRRRDRAPRRSIPDDGAQPEARRPAPMAPLKAMGRESPWSPAASPARPTTGRIVSAIVTKDLKEALQNRTVLSILLGTLFVVLNGSALPALLALQWKPAAMVVDEGRSTILRGLSGRDEFRLALADDREAMEKAVTAGPGTWLGLVLPADFDERAGRDEPIELEGYVAHWADPVRAREAAAAFEEALGLAAWAPVSIRFDGNRLYPTPEVGGQVGLQMLTLVMAVLIVGMMMVPLMMVEERETHTLDALVASPARMVHVVGGKAIVGIVYCTVAAAVVVFLNRAFIVHWDIALLAVLLAAGFSVAIGILIGLVTANATSVGLWGGPILMVMLVPVLLDLFLDEAAPQIVRSLIAWSPSTVMLKLFRFSVAGDVPTAELWLSAALLGAMAVAVYGLATARLRMADR